MASAALESSSPFFFEEPPARILVIEGDVPTADTLCAALEKAGYEVEVATDGQYALMVAADFSADLVLLDMGLAGTGSLEVQQVLKSAPHLSAHYRRIPILYLAESEWLINQRFHQHPHTPISDYIFKPIDEALLLDRVRRALEESKA